MKTYFSTECLAHVEARLRQYPVQVHELAELEKAIEAQARGGSGGLVAASGSGGQHGTSEPERILLAKEGNARLQLLKRTTGEIQKALAKLPYRSRSFIRWRYWEQLEMAAIGEMWHVDTNALWKYRRRLLVRLASVLYPEG